MSIADQLRTLAKGINPDTGECLDSDSNGNSPNAIRLLFALADELEVTGNFEDQYNKPKLTNEEKQARNIKLGRPKNSHLPWTEEEKKRLVSEYCNNDSVLFLAETFERSVFSIAVQLKNAELLTEEDVEFYKSEQLANQ